MLFRSKANLRKVKKSAGNDEPNEGSLIDFKSGLKKLSDPLVGKAEEGQTIVDFKSKLRKSAKTDKEEVPATNEPTVDFKARLRKVSGSKDKASTSPTKLEAQLEQKRESIGSATDFQDTMDPDKRRSTGSISSLRKMWEASPKPSRA